MISESIEVTFKIPIPADKPNLIRLRYHVVDGQLLPIGVAQEVELVEDKNGMRITGVGLILHD